MPQITGTSPERADESPHGSLSPEAYERIRALVLALDRALRSQRLYSENNPILVRHRQDLLRLFGEYLQAHGEVVFYVDPFEFRVSGASVYKNENEQESFAFRLFNDGIRSLTFRPGLTELELKEFLSAMASALGRDTGDSDAVTRFWEREFEHIRYAVADLIVEGPADADQKTADEKVEEILDPKMGMYQTGDGEAGEDAYKTIAPEDLNVTLSMSSVGKMFEDRSVLTPEELRQIQEDIAECDQAERLVLDFVDMVLAVLQEEPDADEFRRTLESLGAVLDHNLTHGELHIAALIMEQVHAFPSRPIRMTNVDPQVLSSSLKALWTPERLQLLFQALNLDTKATPQVIETVIRLMDPSAIPQLLAFLPSITRPQMRETLSRAVASMHKGDLGIFVRMLSSRDAAVVRCGMEVISHLKNDKVVDLLAPFVQKKDSPFRREAIDVLRNYTGLKARKLLLGLLEDSHEETRLLGLRSLASATDREVARQLMAAINRPDFVQKSFRERKTYFEAVAKIARDDFIPYLQSVLDTRSWFKKPELDEQYKLATYGLAVIGTPASLAALQQAARSKNKAVRMLSESALRLLSAHDSTDS